MSPHTARWAATSKHMHIYAHSTNINRHNMQTSAKKENRIWEQFNECKQISTVFWGLTKAVNPVPFIGECHQFKLFQHNVQMPGIWYKMVDIRSWLGRPVFYQIYNSRCFIHILYDGNNWLTIYSITNITLQKQLLQSNSFHVCTHT